MRAEPISVARQFLAPSYLSDPRRHVARDSLIRGYLRRRLAMTNDDTPPLGSQPRTEPRGQTWQSHSAAGDGSANATLTSPAIPWLGAP